MFEDLLLMPTGTERRSSPKSKDDAAVAVMTAVAMIVEGPCLTIVDVPQLLLPLLLELPLHHLDQVPIEQVRLTCDLASSHSFEVDSVEQQLNLGVPAKHDDVLFPSLALVPSHDHDDFQLPSLYRH